ncbi:MAG TPA: hypothetical protein PKI11_15080 [Candidatus Hydrogenedentes bacterium]|nr:hypothetical protein [Candidatus Hydrogenedentota bacterium]HNT87671.1 hypothetical protein [Candidatus Hydrogenedentota bacterium]
MRDNDRDLDTLIESALRAEPMLPTPPALHERVMRRLDVQAMMDRERARFRASMAMMCVAAVAIILSGVLFVAFTNLRHVADYGAPGAKGRLDYIINNLSWYYTGYTGAYSLGLSLLLALGTLLLIIVPLRERMRRH